MREQVMGKDFKRAATREEIEKMTQLVDQDMRDGAIGLSIGLEYEMGSYSLCGRVEKSISKNVRPDGIDS